jgi:hypothetical protein
VNKLRDWWATAAVVRAADLITRERLDELEDEALVELHSRLMELRRRIVQVQRLRRDVIR